jgi:hypothetical protein
MPDKTDVKELERLFEEESKDADPLYQFCRKLELENYIKTDTKII